MAVANGVITPCDHWSLIEYLSNQEGRVPIQTGKSGKIGRHFPVRGKSGNFEQTEKVREIMQNTGK